jgi:hypothetical protein
MLDHPVGVHRIECEPREIDDVENMRLEGVPVTLHGLLKGARSRALGGELESRLVGASELPVGSVGPRLLKGARVNHSNWQDCTPVSSLTSLVVTAA